MRFTWDNVGERGQRTAFSGHVAARRVVGPPPPVEPVWMRGAHPEEFVPQWPSANTSFNHTRGKGQCGTNSYSSLVAFFSSSTLRTRSRKRRVDASASRCW
jgi:hypothetical protein